MIFIALTLSCLAAAMAAIRLGECLPGYQPALEGLAGLLIIAGLAVLGLGLGVFEWMAGNPPSVDEHRSGLLK